MNDDVDLFNGLSTEEAKSRLNSCFANRAWAARVAAGRPYQDLSALLASAESAWVELQPSDWLEAFAAHPRIGEGGGHSPSSSEREQSQIKQASGDTLAALAAENRLYEARFGHVFLISASGRSANEMLKALRQRMLNDPAKELQVAAGEQRKIARLRLEQILKT
ncbi:MAG TPA: 2-oxo-4-hydroxy-4-carboxy-5-ureidoimidazoline decarboxylase [Candidatus Dormibacteraeota bacterium]|nr:2-oxo-4-hydroxy-4-carboxy-5-ureidoimidazoline decarboxylase [Candidatus Dormibacteraeota bacterium]